MATRDPVMLPQLSPRGLWIFRAGWLLALATAIVAPLGGAYVRLASYPRGPTGVQAASLAIDLLPPALLIVTATLLYLRRRRDVVAALLSLSFLLMTGAFFAAEGFFRAVELTWVRDALANAGRAALILVLLTFPDGRFSPRWTIWVALMLVAWTPVAFVRPFPLDVEYMGYLAFLAISVLAIAARYRRLPAGAERQQIRWVLFGFASGTLLLALAIAASIFFRGGAAWTALIAQTLAAAGMMSFASGLIVSLLRYRLYDADAAISRSASLAMLTIGLGALFAGSSEGAKIFIETSLGRDAGALPAVFAAGLAAVMLNPAYELVSGWAERRFQKRLTALRRDLPECVADLRETGGMDELLAEVLGRAATGVSAARAAVLIDDRPAAVQGIAREAVAEWRAAVAPDPAAQELDCDREDPLFPMRVPLRVRHGEGVPIGWILLGARPDGSFYGRDEREALAEIADPVARAVQIVGRREARERALEARLAAIEGRLAADRGA
jgi:hypothetical protein